MLACKLTVLRKRPAILMSLTEPSARASRAKEQQQAIAANAKDSNKTPASEENKTVATAERSYYVSDSVIRKGSIFRFYPCPI